MSAKTPPPSERANPARITALRQLLAAPKAALDIPDPRVHVDLPTSALIFVLLERRPRSGELRRSSLAGLAEKRRWVSDSLKQSEVLCCWRHRGCRGQSLDGQIPCHHCTDITPLCLGPAKRGSQPGHYPSSCRADAYTPPGHGRGVADQSDGCNNGCLDHYAAASHR